MSTTFIGQLLTALEVKSVSTLNAIDSVSSKSFTSINGQKFYFWKNDVERLVTANEEDPITLLIRKDSQCSVDTFINTLENLFPAPHVLTYYNHLNIASLTQMSLADIEELFEANLPIFVFAEASSDVSTADNDQIEKALAATEETESYALARVTTIGDIGTGPWTIEPSSESPNTTCIVVDSGLDINNTERPINVQTGFSFISGEDWDQDTLGHGTSVASLISSATFGLSRETTIIPYKVFGSGGSTSTSTIYSAFNHILENQAPLGGKVINCSFGGPRDYTMDLAVQTLTRAGAVVVASAGNSGVNVIDVSPGASVDCITVGATTANDTVASFSNYGSRVNVWAPGVDVKTATGELDGTSFSAPLVSAAVCMLVSGTSNLSTPQVQSAMLNASQSINGLDIMYCGVDLIDRALAEPVNPPIDPEDPLPDPIEPPATLPEDPSTFNPPLVASDGNYDEYTQAAAIATLVTVAILLLLVLLAIAYN